MHALRTLLGLMVLTACGAACAQQDGALRGPTLAPASPSTTLLLAPLGRGSLGLALGRLEGGLGITLRWDMSPQASASLGWDSQELAFPGSGRETVRATRLGIQWRY